MAFPRTQSICPTRSRRRVAGKAYLDLERDRFAVAFDYAVLQEVPDAEWIPVKPLAWHHAVAETLRQQVLRSKNGGALQITFTPEAGDATCVLEAFAVTSDRSPVTLHPSQRIPLAP